MNGITIHDTASPVVHALANYTPEDRASVNEFVAEHVWNNVRDYLRDYAEGHHATADRLGAKPSNFWGQAAESVDKTSNADGAFVTIRSPGIGRVDHDVDIVPTGQTQWLTIPANAAAYGNRFLVGTAERARFDKAGKLLPPKVAGAPLYIFVKHAHLPQDRSLLPSDDDLLYAAIEGARVGIEDLIARLSGEEQP